MGGKSGNGNRLEQSESQRLEALAGNYRLIALVQTTRLTGGYDFYLMAASSQTLSGRIACQFSSVALRRVYS